MARRKKKKGRQSKFILIEMEKDPKKPGVYRITFPDGHFYIGSAWGKGGIEARWEQHKNKNCSSPVYLQECAQRNCGWKNAIFLVLKYTKNKYRALLWEQAYINRFWFDENGNKNIFLMNKRKNILAPLDPCELSRMRVGMKFSKEHCKNLSIAHIGIRSGKNHPMFGRHHSKESLEKMSRAQKGKRTGDNNPMKRHDVVSKIVGEKHPFSKILDSERDEICRLYKTGEWTQQNLAEKFDIDQTLVSRIVNRWENRKRQRGNSED